MSKASSVEIKINQVHVYNVNLHCTMEVKSLDKNQTDSSPPNNVEFCVFNIVGGGRGAGSVDTPEL